MTGSPALPVSARGTVIRSRIRAKFCLGINLAGKPRIAHDDDWVRIEIDTALKKNIPVIPVLIDRTPLPSKDLLPEELRDLVYRQAAIIDSQIEF